jgi:hypothetical protein
MGIPIPPRFPDPIKTTHSFLGIDIYNDGPAESTITISSPETQQVTVTLKPNELRRLRTAWQTPQLQNHS